LLQDSEITKEQSLIIEETNNALSRVSRINKNLLLLAKIENQQLLDKQQFNMAEPLQDILDLLSGLLEDRKVDSNITANFLVEGNRILVEIMLTNLLMNSLRHTEKDVNISLTLTEYDLVISNPGAYPLNDEKLFRRFSTASSHTPGTGLGLSIVKEICNRYGWRVVYSFIDEQHVFTVKFD